MGSQRVGHNCVTFTYTLRMYIYVYYIEPDIFVCLIKPTLYTSLPLVPDFLPLAFWHIWMALLALLCYSRVRTMEEWVRKLEGVKGERICVCDSPTPSQCCYLGLFVFQSTQFLSMRHSCQSSWLWVLVLLFSLTPLGSGLIKNR